VSAREIARRVLDRVDKGGAWATLTLDAELSRSALDERDRRLASELVYGVLRHRTRIDRAIAAHADLKKTPPKVRTALRIAAYQVLFLDRVPAYAAVDDAVAAAREIGGDKLAGFANAVLRKLTAEKEPPFPELAADASLDAQLGRLEQLHSIPRWILDELTAAVRGVVDDQGNATHAARAARVAQLAEAFAEQPPLIARVNLRTSTRAGLTGKLEDVGITVQSSELVPSALILDGAGDPSKDAAFNAGEWTVQDAGAQLVGHLADPQPGMKILDACAGVGGKSTHLAELTDDRATIDAADQSATKLGLLAETARRLGLQSITTHTCDLTDPNASIGRDYDLIVIDAPCSGLGVLRRHPDAKWRLQPDAIPRLAGLQSQLLDAIAKRLKPGGTLVYAVCTFTRAEGPDQIAAFAKRSGMRVIEERRTWPPDADAFYMAKLVAAD
jgi:16S rRNA (cytosine967-C5)-methyltransferase